MPASNPPGAAGLSCPPAAPVHAWMPTSPCVPSCVDVPAQAGRLRVLARIAAVAGLLVSFPAVNLATPGPLRPRLHRRYARTLLRSCGIRIRILDQRDVDVRGGDEPARARRRGRALLRSGGQVPLLRRGSGQVPLLRRSGDGRGLLVVSAHVGWTDVVALAAVSPMGFVARGDLIEWPMLGGLARIMRVIPIHRERLRQLPEVIATMSQRLAAGERIGLFPEGTTWCGRAHGSLRPALFQAAIGTGTPVQPVRMRYLDAAGELTTVPGFVGVDTFLDSARRVLRSKGVVAEVTLLPVQPPGDDRHELARRCERAMRGPEVLDIDAHATAVGSGPTRAIVPDHPGTPEVAVVAGDGRFPAVTERSVPGPR
ncbi:lysophospholipid acyltransferase family protein [Nocardia sp. alder85J]|uniref:lysophospholipid acyltransferase family protein n=1 Tax=Nocardia sp. alder85J TaxID=2862949 RepID=UPI001CD65F45|nr:lysophospholipid acyltransferase family protein [Nocardia sp. alder85J]MCX4095259.1 lysophospholipid acyltransferase family protein [Nocardia sp. alder85J]